jgi:Metallo-peptidase family M12/IPT/TIG domain
VTARFDWTPLGFHALILAPNYAVAVLPPNPNDTTTYTSAYDPGIAFECGVTSGVELAAVAQTVPAIATGSTLRTYRIAIAADNEVTDLFGNTVAGTVAAINTTLNGVNAIYEKELAVHLNLVDAPNIIYADNNNVCGAGNNQPCTDANDPYTDGDTGAMINQVVPDLRDKVGQANYDIGHVLNTAGIGLAGRGVVCSNNNVGGSLGPAKGGGVSGTRAPAGDPLAVRLLAHEMGHQFGAGHSYNGTSGACTSRTGSSAYEPGSGSTIMSYSTICGSDNVSLSTEDRFHAGSLFEMASYITTDPTGSSCGTQTPTGNTPPSVSAGTPFTIPKLTPFTLSATGNDADASDVSNLTYVWEQLDAGGALYANPPYGDQPGDPNTTTRPLFRVFPPVKETTRTFPSLTYILNNANIPPAVVGGLQTAESLPSVSRTMNFRVTARDNRANGGGVNGSSVAITVDGNSGPFAVTAPNGGGTLSGATTVRWNVANTSAAPVSCANVRITLSTDGGLTFPILLAASVPNNGSANVTIPNGLVSSTARVKVEAVGNIFFDISDANFSVTPTDTCPAVSGISPQVADVGDTVTITGVNFVTGGNVTGVNFSNGVAANFNVVNDTTITATVPAGAVGGPITVRKTSCPDVKSDGLIVCPSAPVALAVDDGGMESARNTASVLFHVNRLTPASYPATLTQIAIYWAPSQNFPPGTAINVLFGANIGGTANLYGTSFQTFPATAGAQPGFTTLPCLIHLPLAQVILSSVFRCQSSRLVQIQWRLIRPAWRIAPTSRIAVVSSTRGPALT